MEQLLFRHKGFYSQIDASNQGYAANKSIFSLNAKISGSINLTKTTLLQVNSRFRSNELSVQGMREPSWVMTPGFRQESGQRNYRWWLPSPICSIHKSEEASSIPNILVQESIRCRDERVLYAGFVLCLGAKGKKQIDPKFEFGNAMEK